MSSTLAQTALSRRRFLQGAGAVCTAAAVAPYASSSVALAASNSSGGDTLVLVILRGGMDGLSAVVPGGDAGYYSRRGATRVGNLLPLDATFGMHPALAPLHQLYSIGDLAVVVGAGSPDPSRSHFDQQAALEGGVPGELSVGTGWLGRHLRSMSGAGLLRGVTVGDRLSPSLLGGTRSTAIGAIERFKVQPPDQARTAAFTEALTLAAGSGPFGAAAADVRGAISLLESARPEVLPPSHGARYDNNHPWAAQFQEVAQLIRSGIGVEIAVLDFGGWDTHVFQGGTDGYLARQLQLLANAIAAFYLDLSDLKNSITVAVVSEFGRTVAENGGAGTDHGRGGVTFVLGGGIRGGQVYGEWLGLGPNELDDGDVPATTDHRDVLGELVVKRLGNGDLGTVFPGYSPRFLELADSI